jgi:hypothetical protein
MDTKTILTAGVIIFTAIGLGWVYVDTYRKDDPYQDRALLKKGQEKPPLWVYVNNSDVNSRHWSGFMERSDRVLSLPFLNLCYQTIVEKNFDKYRIEVIGGLQDLAVRLGGWDALPKPLQNAEAIVREPELNWIRAAVLAKWGGLWVAPATVFLRPMDVLPKERVVFFGSDPEPSFGATVSVPALNVIWSPAPQHALFVNWEAMVRERLDTYAGGSEFRHDEKSDLADAIGENSENVEIMSRAEVSRKGAAQRRVQLEDLLAAGTKGDLPFEIGPNAKYLPIPYPEILERETFGWFLRMSEDQILESDLAISHVLRAALSV